MYRVGNWSGRAIWFVLTSILYLSDQFYFLYAYIFSDKTYPQTIMDGRLY